MATRRRYTRGSSTTPVRAKLSAEGLSVTYVTWLQMDNEPFAVVARVAQKLARAEAARQAA